MLLLLLVMTGDPEHPMERCKTHACVSCLLIKYPRPGLREKIEFLPRSDMLCIIRPSVKALHNFKSLFTPVLSEKPAWRVWDEIGPGKDYDWR